MYVATLALLTVTGAWGAWRANPAYSTRATARYLGVVLGAAAVVVAAVVTAVRLTERSSATVTFVTIACVVLVGTLAMIWLFVRMSMPKPTALPATTKLTTFHRAKLAPWARRSAWVFLSFALLALVLPGDAKVVLGTIGGMLAFLGIVILFAGYVAAFALDRSLTSVEHDPWIHWRYSPERWKAWTDVEVSRIAASPRWQWSSNWKDLVVPGVVIAGIVFALNGRSLPWAYNAGSVGITWLAMIGLIVFGDRYGAAAPTRLRRVLAGATPETYFGAGGIFADGLYTEWQTAGTYLVEATVDERSPRSLAFVFMKYVGGTSGPLARVHRNVLVPAEAEADIAQLQSRVAATCPSARVALC